MSYVFVHGLGQHSTSWDKVIAHFPNDVDIFCPDLAKLVNSQKFTYGKLYKAFEKKCNSMDTPLNLCGISLGAILSLQYAIMYPQNVNSLIMIAPQYKMPRLLLGFQNIIFHIMPGNAFKDMGFAKKDIISLTKSMKELDFTEDMKKIACPSLIICGENDMQNKKACKEMKSIIPNAKIAFVKNAGHEVNVEEPKRLFGLIKKFWLS